MANPDPLNDFEDRVFEDCKKEGLFPPHARVLLSVSGGPDSTALFHVLTKLVSKWDLSLAVAHFNHQTRGAESDQDCLFVRELATDHNVPFFTQKTDVKGWAEKEGYSFQEGARVLRQVFLEQVSQKENYEFIVLGQNTEDQAETVLMNILRGTGPLGLGGMSFRRNNIVRPLIYRTRKEIMDYLKSLGKPFRTDSSNQDPVYLRNRLRLELIPQLEAQYSPRLQSHLSGLARLIGEDEACLSELARDLFDKSAEPCPRGLFLSFSGLDNVPAALVSRVVRLSVLKVKGDLKAVERSHIQAVLDLTGNGSFRAVVLPGDIQVAWESQGLRFSRLDRGEEKEPALSPGIKIRLEIPGRTEIPPADLAIQAWVNPENINVHNVHSAGPEEAFLDQDCVGGEVWARFFQSGDRFWPLGSPGSRKLKSFFIDQKIPREKRATIPVLTDAGGNIIWVYGGQISESCKIVPATRNILYLKGVK